MKRHLLAELDQCLAWWATRDTASETLQHLIGVLDLRRRREAMADQLPPLLKVGRAAEIDGVVLERFPANEQPIAARVFDRALQLDTAAALGPLEQRRGLGDAALELGFAAGLDVDLRDFEHHGGFLPVLRFPVCVTKGRPIRLVPLGRDSSYHLAKADIRQPPHRRPAEGKPKCAISD